MAIALAAPSTLFRLQDQTAEQELRSLQALALALQGASPEYAGIAGEESAEEQMARQSQQLDALDSELAAFERRFASADPEVKRMLANMLSHEMTNPDMLMNGNDNFTDSYLPVATPTSSDSAQTFSIAGGQHPPQPGAIAHTGSEFGYLLQNTNSDLLPQAAQHPPSCVCSTTNTWQTLQGQGQTAHNEQIPMEVKQNSCTMGGGVESSSAAIFPAVTPANSLAQQAVHRDNLSDCAASLPMPASNPPVRRYPCT